MTGASIRHTSKSLAEYVAERDADRFVGRKSELELFGAVLGEEPPASIVFVFGAGGIGKSALLREVQRRAVRRGYRVRSIDGRLSAGPSDELEQAVSDLQDAPLPLLVIDSYERSEAIGAHLRHHLLPTMPAQTRVIIAGRNRPEPAWFTGGWEAVTTSIEISPLSDLEARQLIEHIGIGSDKTVNRILAWAAGEPLALVVGAEAAERVASDEGLDLVDVLSDRLVGDEIKNVDRSVISVASIARAIDSRLVSEVLEGIDGREAIAQLRSLSFAEDLGDRVTLHERIRRSFHTRLARDEPSRERELRRRLADHLHDRAKEGDTRFLIEVGSLFSDPRLRWGWAADDRGAYWIDRARPGDEESAAEALGVGDLQWWGGVRRWFAEAPHSITTVRDTAGRLAGFCILITPATAPGWVDEDAIMKPRLDHAGTRYPHGNVVLWRDAFGFPGEVGSDPAKPLMIALQGAMVGSGCTDSMCTYGTAVVDDPLTMSLAEAYGAVAVPELEVLDGERVVEGRILQHGHGGFIGAARARVYHDLGLSPPASSLDSLREDVRSALKAFHDPTTLAANPLGRGTTSSDRARSVRRLITEAVESAFGETPGQQMARSVLEAGYLQPGVTHDMAARALHLGRSTYFRYLGRGIDRIAGYLAADWGHD